MNNKDLMIAFEMLMANSKNSSVPKSVVDKVIDPRLIRGKSRKGTKHIIHGKVFLGVNYIPGMTPANYRRLHVRDVEMTKERSNGHNLYY
jgi:hypothetical protein